MGAVADADSGFPAPGNVRAAAGAAVGTVAVSWDAVPGAPFYRVGWVSAEDVAAAQAAGRHWLDAFVFSDVANQGQTAFTVTGLAPGRRYAFIVASLGGRFGQASWSGWAFLTLAAGGSLSTPTVVPSPTVVPTMAPAPTPTVVPTVVPSPTLAPTPSPSTPTPSPTLAPTLTPTPVSGGGSGEYRMKVVTGAGFGTKRRAVVYALAGSDTAADLAGLTAGGGASEREACRIIIRDGQRIGSASLGADDRVRVDFLVETPPFRRWAVNYLCVD